MNKETRTNALVRTKNDLLLVMISVAPDLSRYSRKLAFLSVMVVEKKKPSQSVRDPDEYESDPP